MRAISFAVLFAASSLLAAEPKRQSVPIGGEWILSGASVERTKMDGKRVVQLVAKGDARLKKGRNQIVGPWSFEATAAAIECDFPGKRFILKGPFNARRKASDGSMTITEGETVESSMELAFQGESTRIDGPHRIKILDPEAAKAESQSSAERSPKK